LEDITLALARRVQALTSDDVPSAAVDWATCAILDTVGVTLGGAGEEAVRHVAAVYLGDYAGGGSSTILGTRLRASPLDATMLNALASHALDYDDVCDVMGGHPSAPLVAPLLALAQERRTSGSEFVTAYVAGFETEVRLARGVHPVHYDKGWHPTATLGTFGAAAAASHLLRLTETQTAAAFGIAASLAAGIKANFGTMTKSLQVGRCARNGLEAALLAQRGFTANLGALEARQGYFNVSTGPGQHDASRVLADWGMPFAILDPGVGLKPYPCCGSTHAIIRLMLDLRHEQVLRADDVKAIRLRIHARRLAHISNPAPNTGLAAKYSLQYVAARALLSGAVLIRHFENDAWVEPAVVRLLSLTTAVPDPDMRNDTGAEITITLADGRTLVKREESTIHFTRGPGGTPISLPEIQAKFAECATRAMPESEAKRLFEQLADLPRIADLRPVVAHMAAPAGPRNVRLRSPLNARAADRRNTSRETR